jgi:hypothetical protein
MSDLLLFSTCRVTSLGVGQEPGELNSQKEKAPGSWPTPKLVTRQVENSSRSLIYPPKRERMRVRER